MSTAVWPDDPLDRGVRTLGSWELPAAAHVPALLRRELVSLFGKWQLPEDTLDAVLLVATELVTNAVDHARPPIRVRLAVTPAGIRLEVGDGSRDAPRLRPINPSAVRGRGLQMVNRMCARWSWAVGKVGKVVWAEVPTVAFG